VIFDFENACFTLVANSKLDLQTGDRPEAYHVMFDQVAGIIAERKIDSAFIKGTAMSLAGVRKAHLEAAELRGVVQAACASRCEVRVVQMANISRNFGNRKADAYLKDDSFWNGLQLSDLPKGKRGAALTVVTQFGSETPQ
jgi:hypothetical protein